MKKYLQFSFLATYLFESGGSELGANAPNNSNKQLNNLSREIGNKQLTYETLSYNTLLSSKPYS